MVVASGGSTIVVELRRSDGLARTMQYASSVCTASIVPGFNLSNRSNEVEIFFPCVYCHDIIRASSVWQPTVLPPSNHVQTALNHLELSSCDQISLFSHHTHGEQHNTSAFPPKDSSAVHHPQCPNPTPANLSTLLPPQRPTATTLTPFSNGHPQPCT